MSSTKPEDTKLKRHVAIKFLTPELTFDLNAKERLIKEAQAASAIEHPNICNVHEIDETNDGQTYIVMSYYDGETLQQKIDNNRLTLERSIEIALQILGGIKKAHGKGIIHRDIKPANIKIREDGIVKILDFGLAKLSDQSKLTEDSSTLGTVAYMSPEQTKGTDVDHRTDIWSFGVMLYEMFTGKLPFRGDYIQAIIYSILNEEPEPIPKELKLPYGLENIITQCLLKQPEKRYQSIAELQSGSEHC